MGAASSALRDSVFDVVVVDEAAQALEVDVLLVVNGPCIAGLAVTRVCFLGFVCV